MKFAFQLNYKNYKAILEELIFDRKSITSTAFLCQNVIYF